jgi:hypothetical protein
MAGCGRQRRHPRVHRGGALAAATDRLVEVIAASTVRACRRSCGQSRLPPEIDRGMLCSSGSWTVCRSPSSWAGIGCASWSDRWDGRPLAGERRAARPGGR